MSPIRTGPSEARNLEVGIQDLAGDRLVGPVADLVVEASDEITRRRCRS
jgi:hypothetical protein